MRAFFTWLGLLGLVTNGMAGPYTGLTHRVANTTLAMPAQLPAASTNAYTTENAFPGLSVIQPIALATPPGETNRLFVVERPGRIMVITNLAAPTRTVFLDITSRVNAGGEGGLLGLAFHPDYASNGYFFVYYTYTNGFANRTARYQVSATNANYTSPTTEVALISQPDDCSNHNAGHIEFGPDGYLYIGAGDEGSSNDNCNGGNSQRIDKDFYSAILRIDVDKKPGSLPPNHHSAIVAPTNYAVPPDNPFIGATQFNGTAVTTTLVRTEIYAPGFRNPFRFSFDPVSGLLYVGDVGQGAREEIDLVVKGRNYGWKWREGRIATPGIGSPPAGFTNWADPVMDYPRSSSSNYYGYAITGGRVYRGDRLPELVGHYVFGDYSSGFIWSMTHNGTNATSWRYLCSDAEIACFGPDPRNGDLLLCDLVASQVKRLVRTAVASNGLPATLSAAGVFHDLATLTPHEGIVPYQLNLPFWSDNAIKSRWFSIPSTNLLITFDAQANWGSPTSTVWIKHFDLLLTNGSTSSVRRLETRLLVRNSSGNGGYGVTYRWGTSFSDAALVPEAGLDEDLLINESGIIRTQRWRYPSRQECLACHGASAGFALAFNTAQWNRDHAFAPGDTTNQLARLAAVGYFDASIPSVNLLPAHPALTNTAVSVEHRARAYLQVNCAQCHFPGGPVPAAFDARLDRPLAEAGLINGALVNNLGDPTNRVIVPADLAHSVLYQRANTRGNLQMPPVGSTVIDTQGLAVVAAWIQTHLAGYQSWSNWQIQHFGSTTAEWAQATADADGDGTDNQTEYLLGKNPTNENSAWSASLSALANGPPGVIFERVADRSFQVQSTTNLLDPSAWRALDTPANRPYYGASNETVVVEDPSTNEANYYRVRVQGP